MDDDTKIRMMTTQESIDKHNLSCAPPFPIAHNTSEIYVDATPDNEYPIRILEAYLERTRCMWETSGLLPTSAAVWEIMNEHQKQRAEILREAIAKLRAS